MKKMYFLLLCTFGCFGQTQIGADINGEAANDNSGSSVSLSSDGNVMAIGAYGNDGNGSNSGHVRIYQNISGVWTQIGADINGETNSNSSGNSVSLSSDGSVVAIGAPENNGAGIGNGHVRVYQNISGVWTQIGADIDGEASYDGSGYVSLSSDGSVVAIGAPGNDGNGSNSGHVRIYQNISGVWTQIGTDINGWAASIGIGLHVSLSNNGSIVAIGAPNSSVNFGYDGSTRIYQNISGVWTQIGADITGGNTNNYSGYSVSLSSDGSMVAIGSPYNDGNGTDSGRVRIYQNMSGVWTQIGTDIYGEAVNDYSGINISLSGDGSLVAIGSPFNDGNGTSSGHVRIYQNISGVWTQIGVDIDGEAAGDQIGNNSSVSLSSNGNVLAIGSPFNDGNGVDSGHVRVFNLSVLLKSDSFVLDSFSIYPNPTTEILNITLKSNLTLEKVNIYTTLGQLIKTENKSQINISSLTKGTYFVEVITNQGKATKTIIVE
ncbi:MAG: T9SS type A sorting domain-containing protein [Bacteroidota bacterium]